MKQLTIGLVLFGLILGSSLALPALVSAQTALSANIINPASDGQSYSTGQAITFSAVASGGATPYSYFWNFGDGTQGAGQSFSKSYSAAGGYTVSLTVTEAGDTQVTVSRLITITPIVNPSEPVVDLKVNAVDGPISVTTGASPTLSWTTTNATACTASGSWSGDRTVPSGSESIGVLNTVGALTYTLTCTGAGGSNSDSVTINVGTDGNPGPTPVISNIRVTDVTQTSAVIRWTTDILADSRVIYDTTSHPTLDPTHGPNYDYAHSSLTSDTSPKVTEHAVTLTGLTPNTQYFFRVLSQA